MVPTNEPILSDSEDQTTKQINASTNQHFTDHPSPISLLHNLSHRAAFGSFNPDHIKTSGQIADVEFYGFVVRQKAH